MPWKAIYNQCPFRVPCLSKIGFLVEARVAPVGAPTRAQLGEHGGEDR